jgi:hypothetical protein
LAQKQFSEGKIKYWPHGAGTSFTMQLAARELNTLLWNGNPSGASFAPEWRRLSLIVFLICWLQIAIAKPTNHEANRRRYD